MKLSEITQKIKEIEKLIDPGEVNLISSYLSGFIMAYEEDLYELDLIVSNKWLSIREASKSNAMADKMLEISDEYRKRERVKLTISQLKRMRSDLRARYEILSSIKRF